MISIEINLRWKQSNMTIRKKFLRYRMFIIFAFIFLGTSVIRFSLKQNLFSFTSIQDTSVLQPSIRPRKSKDDGILSSKISVMQPGRCKLNRQCFYQLCQHRINLAPRKLNGEIIGRGSKRFGWLQHLRNCMMILSTDIILPVFKLSRVLNFVIIKFRKTEFKPSLTHEIVVEIPLTFTQRTFNHLLSFLW